MKGKRFLVMVLLLVFPFSVQAKGENMLKLQLRNLETERFGVGFELYQVGDMEGVRPVFFKEFGLSGFPEKAAELEAAIKNILPLLKKEPDRRGTTDKQGVLVFDGLKEGIYLVCQRDKGTYGEVLPFLVCLPVYQGKEAVSVLEVTPKASPDSEEEKNPDPDRGKQQERIPVKTGDTSEIQKYLWMGAVSLLISRILMKKRGD